MKRFNFLPVVVALVLAATFVGCTTMSGTQSDYPERPQSNRVYVDDPYRGTVVLERDPYTGRYYEVNPYGTNNNRAYGSYGYGNTNGRNYGRNYDRDNDNDRKKRSYERRNNYDTRPAPQRPTQDQLKEQKEHKDEARRKVLGD